jgi:hypothetical protein
MATNAFFQNYDYFNEQQLIDDLVIESIQIYGVDIIYVTNSIQDIDAVYREDDIPIFDETFDFEVYVKSVDGFEGEGDFMSKFGLEIRDEVTFTLAVRTFEKYVNRNRPDRKRPLEGDLVFFPLNSKMYKIMSVEHESVFYQSGSLQAFDLRCELIEYSGERFETGRDNIDTYFDDIDTTTATTLEELETLDNNTMNLDFEKEADKFLDFSETDPFSENIDIPDEDIIP